MGSVGTILNITKGDGRSMNENSPKKDDSLKNDENLKYKRFKELVEIIFEKTLGIDKSHNERKGLYMDFFATYQLGRDIEIIIAEKQFTEPEIYIGALNEFFNKGEKDCINKTIFLINTLLEKEYFNEPEDFNMLFKCNSDTISIYHEFIIGLWNYYYNKYEEGVEESDIEVYQVPDNILKKIEKKYVRHGLPVNFEFYKKRLPDILELINVKNPKELYTSIEAEYVYLFKNVIENNSFYNLSYLESCVFIDTLYAISDLLDRAHHADSYSINLEILDFFNRIHADDFKYISLDDIRKIQGCIYAIAIETTEQSIKGNIKLTSNHNLARTESVFSPITHEKKIDICEQALKNLLKHDRLKELDNCMKVDYQITSLENKLKKNKYINPYEIKEIYVLSLVYSNIAACELQYIRRKLKTKHRDILENYKVYNKYSAYIRGLIVRITKKFEGKDSDEYKDALLFLASHYHSTATLCYYTKEYGYCIAIRSILFDFYYNMNFKDKARMQLELSPIELFEKDNGDADLYSKKVKSLLEDEEEYLSYLYSNKLPQYEEFKELTNVYENSKKLYI